LSGRSGKGHSREGGSIACTEFLVLSSSSGLTQVELAEKLKQSQSFVSKAERGDRRLDVIQLRTILGVLGMRLADFVRGLERELEEDG
jgi:transcriptional regulator with XRE-family HTH domain